MSKAASRAAGRERLFITGEGGSGNRGGGEAPRRAAPRPRRPAAGGRGRGGGRRRRARGALCVRWPRPSAAVPAGPCPRHGRGAPPCLHPSESPPRGARRAPGARPARPGPARVRPAACAAPCRKPGQRAAGLGALLSCGAAAASRRVLPRGSGRLLGAHPRGFPGPWGLGAARAPRPRS